MKQFAPSTDHNRDEILLVLKEICPQLGTILEIGSGTGQHAVHFARHLQHLAWQPSDLEANLPSIRAWAAEASLPNLHDPIVFDLLAEHCPALSPAVIVCINTVHIVAWRGVENLFTRAGQMLQRGGLMYVYGAYRYADRPLEPSNETFDAWLKARNPVSGVRDFELVDALAKRNGLALVEDRAMPGNNRSIWWEKN